MSAQRSTALRDLILEAGLDAIALVPGPNLYYFSSASFHLSERPIIAFLPAYGDALLVVPTLEAMKAESMPFPTQVFSYSDGQDPADSVAEALAALALQLDSAEAPERDGLRDDGRIWLGVEGRRARFLELDLMQRAEAGPRVFDADEILAELRMRKDSDEIAAMREAVSIAEAALLKVLPQVRPGVTERELAAELVLQLLRGGSETPLPFEPIVAAGPTAASPHARGGDRKLEAGDLLLIDWGASKRGYFSDITRTYAVGGADVSPEMEAAYAAVLAGNAAGRAAVKPGATGAQVDAAARAAIESAGLGEYFIHRTGHGLGLETHEEPDMKVGVDTVLEPGMTFTVEPGVYLPGIGGVRIEDDMVVTESGGESLTSLDRELRYLGGAE